MAIEMVEMPDINNANMDEWRLMIADMEMLAGGLLLLGVENLDTSGEPVIRAGSRFEINGSFFKVVLDEAVGGTPAEGQNYVYAIAEWEVSRFEYRADAPVWMPEKGGWYSGNDRAILKLFYYDGKYNGKVILENYAAFDDLNIRQDFHGETGVQVHEFTQVMDTQIMLAEGVYHVELRGGRAGGDASGQSGGAAGAGAYGKDTRMLYYHYGGTVNVKVGADGGNGGNGGAGGGSGHWMIPDGASGQGGGGGAGGDTRFTFLFATGGVAGSGSQPGHASGYGGRGADGENVFIPPTSYDGSGTYYYGQPGSPGGPPLTTTQGWCKIWRVG